MRWPELFFAGASAGNSDSQYRSTYGWVSVISQTSPILKNSLFGICLSIGCRRLLDHVRSADAGCDELRRTEHDRAAGPDEHFLSRLGIASAPLALLADQERAEAGD